MLLQFTTAYTLATDLGYSLVKHPNRSQRYELPFGAAWRQIATLVLHRFFWLGEVFWLNVHACHRYFWS
jgi:hypothetical protein